MEDSEVEVVGSDRRRDRRGRVVVEATERLRLLELYDRSGQSQQDFAREQGINYNTLVNWLYQRRKRESRSGEAGNKPMRFHEVSLPGAGDRDRASLTIRLPNGVVMEVGDEPGLELAMKALRWLRERDQC